VYNSEDRIASEISGQFLFYYGHRKSCWFVCGGIYRPRFSEEQMPAYILYFTLVWDIGPILVEISYQKKKPQFSQNIFLAMFLIKITSYKNKEKNTCSSDYFNINGIKIAFFLEIALLIEYTSFHCC